MSSNPSLAQDDINLSKLIFEGVLLTDTELEAGADILLSSGSMNTATKTTVESSASISQYQEALAILDADEGPFSGDRAELLKPLGLLYQENGDHDAAITAFQNAQQIIRINEGLFTLNQTSNVRSMIESYKAQEKYAEMDNLQAYLFYIQQKNYSENDLEMLVYKQEWANLNVQSFLRNYNHPNSRPLFNNGNENLSASDYILVSDRHNAYYIPRFQTSDFAGSSVNMHSLVEPRLRLARDLYESILEQNETSIDDPAFVYTPQNIELHLALANIAYIVKTQMETMADYSSSAYDRDSPFQTRGNTYSGQVSRKGYLESRRFFESLVINLKQASEPDPVAIAQALLNLSDWNLAFNQSQRAFRTYEEAYSLLMTSGRTIHEVTKIMQPEDILPIPTYATHPYSRQAQQISQDTQVHYKGYIDVKLSLSRQGKNGGIRILESSSNTPKKIRTALLGYLKEQRIRPKMIGGHVEKQSGLLQRYYYAY